MLRGQFRFKLGLLSRKLLFLLLLQSEELLIDSSVTTAATICAGTGTTSTT